MIKEHSEEVTKDFEGTIIDLETIGNFKRIYPDSREYSEIIPVIFGIINKNELKIIYAENKDDISELKEKIKTELPTLQRPLYAFNSNFEKGTLYHSCSCLIEFERELNLDLYEGKWKAVKNLEISNYDDPFNDDGLKCKKAWENDEIDDTVAHNRSCLLKERDILLKRGFREPDKLKMMNL